MAQPPDFDNLDVRMGPVDPPSFIVNDIGWKEKDCIFGACGGSEDGNGVSVSFKSPLKGRFGPKKLNAAGPRGRVPAALEMAWKYMAGELELPDCPPHANDMRKAANAERDRKCLPILYF